MKTDSNIENIERFQPGLPRFRDFALPPSVSLLVLSFSPYSLWVKEKLMIVVFFKLPEHPGKEINQPSK